MKSLFVVVIVVELSALYNSYRLVILNEKLNKIKRLNQDGIK